MFHKLATFLVILGAANIGLTTMMNINVIGMFGTLAATINVLVGVAGLYMFLTTYTTLIKKA